MDIIISAHFGPIPVCRLASVYRSDNILSVWGLEEEEKKNPGRIFLFVFIRCLWGSWKCRVAVYMAKYTLREIRHPRMFLRRHTEERDRPRRLIVSCVWWHILHRQPEILFPPSSHHFLEERSLFLMTVLIWRLGYNVLYWLQKRFVPVSTLMRINLLFGTTLIDCKTAYICRKICFATVCLC